MPELTLLLCLGLAIPVLLAAGFFLAATTRSGQLSREEEQASTAARFSAFLCGLVRHKPVDTFSKN